MSKKDRLSKLDDAVSKADLKTESHPTTENKPETVRKHISMPKEWSDIIKTNYAGTANSYIISALRKQLESDGYI